ncbi:MAG: phage integrase N-terminal SAM-like domain-containing protein [Phycisphaerae bacterium]
MKDIRQRMIEDMKLRGLTPSTQATYLEAVKVLARHYNRRLDEITQEQVRDFLLYLIDSKGYAKSTYKVYLSAIKFLYLNTLGQQWRFLPLARVSPDRKLPIVLSREEVWSLLDMVPRDKPRMSLMLMYTCGLQHVLPSGVHKVRYYGLWSPSNRKKLLELQQTLAQSGNDQQEGFEQDMDAEVSAPSEPRQCPHCQKGTLVWIGRLPRQGRAPP